MTERETSAQFLSSDVGHKSSCRKACAFISCPGGSIYIQRTLHDSVSKQWIWCFWEILLGPGLVKVFLVMVAIAIEKYVWVCLSLCLESMLGWLWVTQLSGLLLEKTQSACVCNKYTVRTLGTLVSIRVWWELEMVAVVGAVALKSMDKRVFGS